MRKKKERRSSMWCTCTHSVCAVVKEYKNVCQLQIDANASKVNAFLVVTAAPVIFYCHHQHPARRYRALSNWIASVFFHEHFFLVLFGFATSFIRLHKDMEGRQDALNIFRWNVFCRFYEAHQRHYCDVYKATYYNFGMQVKKREKQKHWMQDFKNGWKTEHVLIRWSNDICAWWSISFKFDAKAIESVTMRKLFMFLCMRHTATADMTSGHSFVSWYRKGHSTVIT